MRGLAQFAVGTTLAGCWLLACSITTSLPEPYQGVGGAEGVGGMGGAAAPCDSAADCTGDEGDCVTRTCIDRVCGVSFMEEGFVLESQRAGDCLTRVCNGAGAPIEIPDVSDIQSDNEECTTDSCDCQGQDCESVVLTFRNRAAGEACTDGGTLCSGEGHCVECVTAEDCDGTPGCVNQNCVCDPVAFVCELQDCINTLKDDHETDVDCGGMNCSPCPVMSTCTVGGDCITGSCDGNTFQCLAATCTDSVKNGDETDVDCGGGSSQTDCDPCADGQECVFPADCDSGVCGTNFLCAAPACTDGVLNGDETDDDCGGPACDGCAKGRSCSVTRDCKDGLVCRNKACSLIQETSTGSIPHMP